MFTMASVWLRFAECHEHYATYYLQGNIGKGMKFRISSVARSLITHVNNIEHCHKARLVTSIGTINWADVVVCSSATLPAQPLTKVTDHANPDGGGCVQR